MGRDRDEIQELALEVCKEWMAELIEVGRYTAIIEMVILDAMTEDDISQLHGDIENNKMLYKEQAKMLEYRIDYLVQREVNKKTVYGRRMEHINALFIDELSMYPDIWGQYCRPGTYMIVQ